MKCPDPSWEDDCLGSHKFDKDGFCIFCGNKEPSMTHEEQAEKILGFRNPYIEQVASALASAEKKAWNEAIEAAVKVAEEYELSSKAESALCCNQDAVLQGKKPYVGSQEMNGVDWASAEIAESINKLKMG